MTLRSEQKEKRREQILAAGLSLFVKNGLAATKVSDIAEAVGMSVGLLFHYFSSKEQLYEELVHIGLDKSRLVLADINDEPLDFLAKIANDILYGSRFTIEMFVFMNQATNCKQLSKETQEKLENDNFLQTAEIIKTGQSQGTIRSGDPFALAMAFWGTIQGICEILVHKPTYPKPDTDWLLAILRKQV